MTTVDVIVPLERSEERASWREAAARELGVSADRIHDVRLRKHSIDARQRQIKVQLRLEVGLDAELPPDEPPRPDYPNVGEKAPKVVIVGCGPAGIFAALRSLELGFKPVVLERGKDASTRRFDLRPILNEGRVMEDSNYCFGEGGAGTFSDGKLYTRAKKRGPLADVYRTLVAHGAPERILIDAHPHIGSNLLPNVVMAMRRSIVESGGEVHFSAKVTELIRRENRLCGVATKDGREFTGAGVVLATGHSARDIYRLLMANQIRLEQKAFAVGVRIEHPQPVIDAIQYHLRRGEKRPDLLPAASYRLATRIADRGVHSFCMCPGGFIVPSATANGEVVVNGMSLAKRDSPFANSGMVVAVEPEDTRAFRAEHGVMAGMVLQQTLEQAAFVAGGGGQTAPGQRAVDFIAGAGSSDLPPTSYRPGITAARIDELLPEGIVRRLRQGLKLFGEQKPGYLNDDVNLIGFETRTSSPLRIPRDEKTMQHPELSGLYPCGEGAGFAGGIVSAALDGIRCVEALCNSGK